MKLGTLLLAGMFLAGALAAFAPASAEGCTPLPPVGEVCAGEFGGGDSCDGWHEVYTGAGFRALGTGAGVAGYSACGTDYAGAVSQEGLFARGYVGATVGGVAWYSESRDGTQTCHMMVWAKRDAGASLEFQRDLGCPAGPPPDMAWGSMLPPLP